MNRCFAGLRVPAGTLLLADRKRLMEAAAKMKLPLRWSDPLDFHVTLYFFGTLETAALDSARAALELCTIGMPKFTLQAKFVGAFPEPRSARVLWGGVATSPELVRLQTKVAAELESRGFPREARAFSPHITLARAKPAADLRSLVSGMEYEEFSVDSITLYESLGDGNIPRYAERAVFPLGT